MNVYFYINLSKVLFFFITHHQGIELGIRRYLSQALRCQKSMMGKSLMMSI